jgi:predicted DNA-binding transcriptional regulator AlpA
MSISEGSTVVMSQSMILTSWKEIAKYLGKGVRTAQRWESQLGLPVRRPIGASQKSAVLLHRDELDVWLTTRFSARPAEDIEAMKKPTSLTSTRSLLKENVRKASELRMEQHALTLQIAESVRRLAQRCDQITTQTLQTAWTLVPPGGAPTTPLSSAPTSDIA